MINHPNRSKIVWLKGTGGSEFLQFAATRITREPFPLGGYLYTVTDSGTHKTLYSGSSYQDARDAVRNHSN